MRILFYLPVVTPWWFAHIVVPLLRAATRGGEAHVVVPPLWRGTGLGEAEIDLALMIGGVHWHALDGAEHPALRFDGGGHEAVALAREIDADVTLCRSADIATAALFPGTVRFIMEGGVPPLRLPSTWVQFTETLFDQGFVPALDPADADALAEAIRPWWRAARAPMLALNRAAVLGSLGLPVDRPVVAVPLEYEHPEMFFAQHNRVPDNAAMLRLCAERLGDGVTIAATNHPLNEQHCDNRALHEAVEALDGRVRLLPGRGALGATTGLLAAHADGMVVGNSKSVLAAAAFGTPTCRLTRFRTAGWLRCHHELDAFAAALAGGTARGALPDDALRHAAAVLLNTLIDPADPALDAAALAAHARVPADPRRWAGALDRFLSLATPALAA